jgi:hypothetical protein
LRHVSVVADRYRRFTDGAQVVTVSDFVRLASSATGRGFGGEWILHLGQGVDHSDWETLESVVAADDTVRMRLSNPEALAARPMPPSVVHKSRPENVLLANFRTGVEGCCSADLRIHRDNELLVDQRDAGDVSEMVVVEAVRQICIAQFETGYRPGARPFDYVGIWRRMNLTFGDFLFALPAAVTFEITEADIRKEFNLRFAATVSMRQHDLVVATAELEYSMIRKERADVLEGREAASAVRSRFEEPAG